MLLYLDGDSVGAVLIRRLTTVQAHTLLTHNYEDFKLLRIS
jgi:hypothetical protein